MLNEIREEYKIKDNEMREELHRKCRFFFKYYFIFFVFLLKIYMNIINILKNKLIKIFLK